MSSNLVKIKFNIVKGPVIITRPSIELSPFTINSKVILDNFRLVKKLKHFLI